MKSCLSSIKISLLCKHQAEQIYIRLTKEGFMLNKYILTVIFLLCESSAFAGAEAFSIAAAERLEERIKAFTEGKDARIGVALLTDTGIMVGVNMNEPFPMLSVYKFPQALAVAEYCRQHGISFSDSISISSHELLPDTYSPLRDKYGCHNVKLPILELLTYTLQLSDNNACDILFRFTGGPAYTDSLMTAMGFDEIKVRDTEASLHEDTHRCYRNTVTPAAMARMLNKFHKELYHAADEYRQIATIMESCATGTSRLVKPFSGEDVVIGHKTGTGDVNSDGRIIAVNDVGYFVSGDGSYFCLAVFVCDSKYSMDESETLIASISQLVQDALLQPRY